MKAETMTWFILQITLEQRKRILLITLQTPHPDGRTSSTNQSLPHLLCESTESLVRGVALNKPFKSTPVTLACMVRTLELLDGMSPPWNILYERS